MKKIIILVLAILILAIGGWILFENYIVLNVPVNTHEELLQKTEKNKPGKFLVEDKLEISVGILLENKNDITLSGNTATILPNCLVSTNSIHIKNCQNFELNQLSILAPLKFENCKGVVISNCSFFEKNATQLFFDDECSNIVIQGCKFYGYNDNAIEIPLNKLSLSGNEFYYYENEESVYDFDYKISFRNQSEPYKLNNFYQKLFSNSSYYFSDMDTYQYSENLKLGVFKTHITDSEISYDIANFIKNDKPELSGIEDINFVSILKMLSGGINPVLNKPVNNNYISEDESPLFRYINPDFLSWWHKKMIPLVSKTEEAFNFDFKTLYNKSFRYQVHAFIESYLYLQNNFNIEEEATWYMEFVEGGAYMPVELREKFLFTPVTVKFSEYKDNDVPGGLEYMENPLGNYAGFWIRRHIDGTDEQIFSIFKDILKVYDPDFYQWIETGEYTKELNKIDLITLNNFIKSYMDVSDVEYINQSIEEYNLISTAKEMADFYLNRLDTVIFLFQNGINEYRAQHNSDESEVAHIWKTKAGNSIPFLIFEFDNSIEGAGVYKSISSLLEKSKNTEGEEDELFFEAQYMLYGSYPSVYITSLHSYDGGGYSHSTLGNGNHFNILEHIIMAKSERNYFKGHLDNMERLVLSFENERLFGNTKDKVYEELNKILGLKTSKKLDVTSAIQLKSRLDTAAVSVYYNCEDGHCFEHF